MFTPYNTMQKYCSPACRPKTVRKVRKKTRPEVGCKAKGIGKAKKKYKRKSKYAIAKSTVDRKWAEVIRTEAGKCALCPATTGLQAHHVIARSNHAVRWNLDNGVALCALHHTFGNKLSAHKTPIDFAIAMLKQRGQQWYDDLRIAARFPDAMNRDDANTMLTNRLKGIPDERQTDENRFGS
jgi:5-methylcytosine-specific restriction endonuclease McrA